MPDSEEEIDEDTMEELQAIIEADYEVGIGVLHTYRDSWMYA